MFQRKKYQRTVQSKADRSSQVSRGIDRKKNSMLDTMARKKRKKAQCTLMIAGTVRHSVNRLDYEEFLETSIVDM